MKSFLIKFVAGLVVLIVVCGLLLWSFSPSLVRYFSAAPLAQHGLLLSDASTVRYNPFKSTLSLQHVVLSHEGRVPLKVKSVLVEFNLLETLLGDVHIRKVSIDGLYLEIFRTKSAFLMAGFDLSGSADTGEEPASDGRGFVAPQISISNSQVTLLNARQSFDFIIHSLGVSNLSVSSLSQSFAAELKASFQETLINVDSDVSLSEGQGSIVSVLDIQQLNLELFKPYLPKDRLALHKGAVSVRAVSTTEIEGGEYELSIEDLEVSFSDVLAEYDNQRLEIEEGLTLKVNALKVNQGDLIIDKVLIDSLNSAIQLNEEGGEPHPKDSSGGGGKQEAEVEAAPSASYRVNGVYLLGKNTIRVMNNRVSPADDRVFHIERGEVTSISNKGGVASSFSLLGRSNEYAKIELKGAADFFSDTLNFNVTSSVLEVSLPSVSPYIKSRLGFELASGQLDSELNVAVIDDEISGDLRLHLRGLKMERADLAFKSNLQTKTSIPLNYALGLLQDKAGNVKLKIPLSGSLNDPEFGVGSFVSIVTKKAVMSAAKSYLMKTFVPYSSVVSVAMAAGGHVFKLRFKDLQYGPQQVEVGEAQQRYVEQFVTLMKKKDKAQVKICGVATAADIAGLPSPLKKDQDDYEKNITALKLVAKHRADNFKAMAVSTGGLESARMLVCSPSVDLGKKASPKITISI